MRLLTKLHTLYPDSSGRARKQWVAAGRVRVNGQVVRRGDVELGEGDKVELGIEVPRDADRLRFGAAPGRRVQRRCDRLHEGLVKALRRT